MSIAAIISEYDPFHKGHQYQIEQTRKRGATHIVSIMSGNFTQRGLPSIVSKYTKAEIALQNGCDLVIELPTPYSISSAERFAFGATFLAEALGCIDFLSFGCEDDNISELQLAAQVAMSREVLVQTKIHLKKGISFASARTLALRELHGKKISNLFLKPNNILAIEYIKNLNLLNSKIKPLAILRQGAMHDSSLPYSNFASSSLLRNMLLQDNLEFKKYVSEVTYEILLREREKGFAPATLNNCERAILAKLRTLTKEDYLKIDDVNEGLENKIFNVVQKATSLSEVYTQIKSKRYTQLRIQRIVLSAFLNISKELQVFAPPYIKVLGFNRRGKEILKLMKQKTILPIVTNASDVKKIESIPSAMKLFSCECKAYNLYNIMLPTVRPCGFEMTTKLVKF